ncbi:MarR family winged helix-turn-helix transcriptional regulator [Aureibacter tunicatorum]|uniref:DNA-binding MarR family transcriptional regulator n=1 Tax=Aureibacter tunicatorum TaxID=866807 RepID=A0AAE4BTL9_9BACT|nr:MarR family transcriptional regulator [Aureibacter tunicatorum]MDR6240100.1 DNA-binding MarR family transcriptional regulator [Aureibacter tunicatorum]BDD04571.1 MarR family transcriptional regulator [Aureibacter tunicatorum]
MSDLDDSIKTKFENEKHRFVTNLIFTSNWIKNGFSDFLAPFGISSQQFNILRILRGAGDWVTMNEVKNLMIDKSPHTTRMTTKLLDKKLLERKRCEEDRRVVYVSITKEGLALLAEIDQGGKEQMSFLEKISEEDAKTVNSILDKLRE